MGVTSKIVILCGLHVCLKTGLRIFHCLCRNSNFPLIKLYEFARMKLPTKWNGESRMVVGDFCFPSGIRA